MKLVVLLVFVHSSTEKQYASSTSGHLLHLYSSLHSLCWSLLPFCYTLTSEKENRSGYLKMNIAMWSKFILSFYLSPLFLVVFLYLFSVCLSMFHWVNLIYHNECMRKNMRLNNLIDSTVKIQTRKFAFKTFKGDARPCYTFVDLNINYKHFLP